MTNLKIILLTFTFCFFAEITSNVLQNKLEQFSFGNISFAKTLYGPIPDAWDWRNHSGVTSVKDQGSCPACWAFSIIGCIESQVLIKYKRDYDLSEQMLIDCGSNGGCKNGKLTKGFANLVTYLGGPVHERDYPYLNQPQAGKCKDHSEMKRIYVMGFSRVAPHEEQMRQYIYKVGPLAAAINPSSMNKYPQNGAWIDTPSPQDCDPKDLSHTVLIVGYDTYVTNGVRIPFWIIKNSWGSEWGDRGFYYLQRGRNACGIASDIVFGIISNPSLKKTGCSPSGECRNYLVN